VNLPVRSSVGAQLTLARDQLRLRLPFAAFGGLNWPVFAPFRYAPRITFQAGRRSASDATHGSHFEDAGAG